MRLGGHRTATKIRSAVLPAVAIHSFIHSRVKEMKCTHIRCVFFFFHFFYFFLWSFYLDLAWTMMMMMSDDDDQHLNIPPQQNKIDMIFFY